MLPGVTGGFQRRQPHHTAEDPKVIRNKPETCHRCALDARRDVPSTLGLNGATVSESKQNCWFQISHGTLRRDVEGITAWDRCRKRTFSGARQAQPSQLPFIAVHTVGTKNPACVALRSAFVLQGHPGADFVGARLYIAIIVFQDCI
jgi:hypothetical protein